MLENLTAQPADKILALMASFRADPRSDKVDLGVGVYRDEAGGTPIPRAVKKAERYLVETQETKAYLGSAGDEVFNADHHLELAERREHDGDAPIDRLTTKFERRGLARGHRIVDWRLQRTCGAQATASQE